jgi:hypothetical protein
LKSRWTETKIVVDNTNSDNKFRIEWLDLEFWIEEWIKVANFINKMKWDQLIANPLQRWKFQFSWWWDLEIEDWLFDINILNSGTIDKNYPTIKDKDKFIEYLNKM